MMAAVTGRLGSGKGLFCVQRIEDYLLRGKPVATNMDLDLVKLLPARARSVVVRLPDHPTTADLEAIGRGNDVPDETENGLIVLDEGSHFLGSRTWNDKGRAEFLRFLSHSRKLGWDVFLQCQHIDQIDSQARESFLEHTIRVTNMSRVSIPFVGGLIGMMGFRKHHLPRSHLAVARLGTDSTAPVADRWFFRAERFYPVYNTLQIFGGDEAVTSSYCHLSPWHLVGRYRASARPLWHWPPLLVYWAAMNIHQALQPRPASLRVEKQTQPDSPSVARKSANSGLFA